MCLLKLLLSLLFLFQSSHTLPLSENVLLITGGYNGSNFLSTSEVLPAPCTVPVFPGSFLSAPHYSHTTAFTTDGLLLTCGGITTPRTCLVLDISAQTWTSHSHLDQSRISSTSVILPEGLFLFGDDLYDEKTSSFLATGTSDWEAGPSPPGEGITGACAIVISDFQFVLIGGRYVPNQVVEYDTRIAQWTMWPNLEHGRSLVTCAKLGDNVIISGGDEDPTTSILHLPSQEERSGGNMTITRGVYFHMAILGGKVLAIGGDDGHEYLDSIEVWDEDLETWSVSELKMQTARYSFGYIVAPVSAVCKAI